MMSRMSLTGHLFVGLGDAVVGMLLGLGAVSITGLAMLPLAQSALGRSSRRLAGMLLLSGLLVGSIASVSPLWPYSCEWD